MILLITVMFSRHRAFILLISHGFPAPFFVDWSKLGMLAHLLVLGSLLACPAIIASCDSVLSFHIMSGNVRGDGQDVVPGRFCLFDIIIGVR